MNFTNEEITAGVSSNSKYQIVLDNAVTVPIDFVNDNADTVCFGFFFFHNLETQFKIKTFLKITSKFSEMFGIRCPNSLHNTVANQIAYVNDFETDCQYDEQPLDQTAFCGKCARRSPWAIVSPDRGIVMSNNIVNGFF